MSRSIPLLLVLLALLLVVQAQAAPTDAAASTETAPAASAAPADASPTLSAATTCNISQQCSNGSSVSCSGPAGTCTSGSTWVECNGTRYNCPDCGQYCTPCTARVTCSYGGLIECDSSQTTLYHYCEEGADYVYCEGAGTLTCDECFPQIWCSIP